MRVVVTWLACSLVLLSFADVTAAEPLPPLRVAVISDLNGAYGTAGHRASVSAAVSRIIELRPDLVISTGDMIAGQLREPAAANQLGAMWGAFHEAVTNPLAAAGIPLAVTPGNHDASAYERFSLERAYYAREWRDRKAGLDLIDAGDFPFNYAFAMQGVLFISLDVTTTGLLPKHDLGWLDSVLMRHAARFRKTVVFSHVPVWPVAAGREVESTRDMRLHRLLVSHGVDAYLSGHHHAFYPGAADGVAYISQACLGSAPRALAGSGSATAPRAFTLLAFDADRILVDALRAPDFRSGVNWSTLPRQIDAGDFRLTRADLSDIAVAPLPQLPADRKRQGGAAR